MLQPHAWNLLGEDEAQTELTIGVAFGMGGSFVVQLCQRGLCRMQPEGHAHGAVQLDSGGQFRVGLFYLPYPPIQGAEVVVAVGLERAHAQLIGQGQGLPVVGFGLFGVRQLAMHRDVAEEPQGVGFVAPFFMGPGELKGALRLGASFVQPAGEQIRLAQPDHPKRMVEHVTHGDAMLAACSSNGRASAVRPARA
jgi:hypothetical protein